MVEADDQLPALELPSAVFGPHADVNWSITAGATAKEGGPFSVEEDPLLARPVLVCGTRPLTLEGRTSYGEVEIDCRVRLGTTAEKPTAYFTLVPARDPADPKNPGLPLTITGTFDGGLNLSALATGAQYKLRAHDRILPTWDESVRVPIERDMSALPLSQDKWVHVRYRLAKESVRIWVDDRLFVDRHDPKLKTAGTVRVALQPGSRLAELSVHSIPAEEPNFDAIPLEGYVHDRALVQGAAVAQDALPFRPDGAGRRRPVFVHRARRQERAGPPRRRPQHAARGEHGRLPGDEPASFRRRVLGRPGAHPIAHSECPLR